MSLGRMDLLAALRTALPATAVLTTDADKAAYETDWRHVYSHPALCVVLPETAAQVAAVLRLCRQAGIAVVPQGGNTGLVAGAVPVAGPRQVVLGLRRMNKILGLDTVGDTITAEAGVTLQAVQESAAAAGKLFPLSLAAEGTAQIGGLIATNAGGLQVLSYGSMRALVLGLQVVLADGRVWDGLRGLRKDNTGFDLKQVFIGAEGTLGIVTAAVLRLFPAVATRATALIGAASIEAAVEIYAALRERAGAALTMCEFIATDAMNLAAAHVPDGCLPFAAPAYVLAELSSHEPDEALQERLETALSNPLQAGAATDAVVAQSERERHNLLRLREAISDSELAEGGAVKHDIAVPLAALAQTVRAATALVAERFADCRLNIFGHLGDGNLHVNVRPPAGQTLADLAGRYGAITQAVEDLAMAQGGSFSAEHGIGQMRLAGMARYKSTVELDLMRTLKHALDPANLLNPGKLLPP